MTVAETIYEAYKARSRIRISLDDGTVYDGVRIIDYNATDILVDTSEGVVQIANGMDRPFECIIEHDEIDDADVVED